MPGVWVWDDLKIRTAEAEGPHVASACGLAPSFTDGSLKIVGLLTWYMVAHSSKYSVPRK